MLKKKQANKHKLMEEFDTFWTQITKTFSSKFTVEVRERVDGFGSGKICELAVYSVQQLTNYPS